MQTMLLHKTCRDLQLKGHVLSQRSRRADRSCPRNRFYAFPDALWCFVHGLIHVCVTVCIFATSIFLKYAGLEKVILLFTFCWFYHTLCCGTMKYLPSPQNWCLCLHTLYPVMLTVERIWILISNHRHGNHGPGSSCCLKKIIGGASNTSCSPIFSVTYG